jgi:hypothetical protein
MDRVIVCHCVSFLMLQLMCCCCTLGAGALNSLLVTVVCNHAIVTAINFCMCHKEGAPSALRK